VILRRSARIERNRKMPVGLWRNLEARRQEKYERRKMATQKAAQAKADEEEALRTRMEAGKSRAPGRLTRRELMLIAENHKTKKRKLVTAAVGAIKR
jgi:hypothetical protein